MILYGARAGAMAGRVTATFAPWFVNAILGVSWIGQRYWRGAASDQPIRINLPRLWGSTGGAAAATNQDGRRSRVVVVIRVPHIAWPRPRLLDLYVSRQY